jgi:hypothetical protein
VTDFHAALDKAVFQTLSTVASGGRSYCPVAGCPWYIDVPESTTAVNRTDVGGLSISATGVATSEVEAVLRGHLETHDVLDWVRTVQHRNDHAITNATLSEVQEERARQDARFGEQNHPDIGGRVPEVQRSDYTFDLVQIRKRENRMRVVGRLGWDLILLEEVYEALAESDPALLRAELVQVAAVAAAWIEAIDRRAAPA